MRTRFAAAFACAHSVILTEHSLSAINGAEPKDTCPHPLAQPLGAAVSAIFSKHTLPPLPRLHAPIQCKAVIFIILTIIRFRISENVPQPFTIHYLLFTIRYSPFTIHFFRAAVSCENINLFPTQLYVPVLCEVVVFIILTIIRFALAKRTTIIHY